MADTNPANFANLPKDKVQEIASMGGKASHKNDDKNDDKENADDGRREDGTFLPGSEAAKQAGHVGGLHSHSKDDEEDNKEHGRREDGTFLPGSEAAKEAGHKGGLSAAVSNN